MASAAGHAQNPAVPPLSPAFELERDELTAWIAKVFERPRQREPFRVALGIFVHRREQIVRQRAA